MQIASMIGRLFAAIDKQPTPLTVVKPMPDFFAALASGARYRGLAWLLRHADHPCARLSSSIMSARRASAQYGPPRGLRRACGTPCRLISRALALGLGRRPDTAALVRTTLAATRMAAGVADNVLPQTGEVTFNARHLPGTYNHNCSFFNALLRSVWPVSVYTTSSLRCLACRSRA
jgi:hypothetical protein